MSHLVADCKPRVKIPGEMAEGRSSQLGDIVRRATLRRTIGAEREGGVDRGGDGAGGCYRVP